MKKLLLLLPLLACLDGGPVECTKKSWWKGDANDGRYYKACYRTDNGDRIDCDACVVVTN